MRRFLPSHMPSFRQITLWVLCGVLLGTALHGYWLLFCVVLVAVIALFVIVQ